MCCPSSPGSGYRLPLWKRQLEEKIGRARSGYIAGKREALVVESVWERGVS